ncbi:MAG: hypothetical protein QW604_04305 [Fervidicoccaceae archaeon]
MPGNAIFDYGSVSIMYSLNNFSKISLSIMGSPVPSLAIRDIAGECFGYTGILPENLSSNVVCVLSM